jgi:predicted GNAT family N-acyltransferase
MNLVVQTHPANNVEIVNTTTEDWEEVLRLFDHAMQLQGKNGYHVWKMLDTGALRQEIEQGCQYKVVRGTDVLCVFSIQYTDPFIWRERDQNDAVYLHRIVTNPLFKGQRQFEKVLSWTRQLAQGHSRPFIRMDTWADNKQLVAYYASFGFEVVEHYLTPNIPELLVQNRGLDLALLELAV